LRRILAVYLREQPQRIQLRRGAHGKPRLGGIGPSLEFNLSHSGEIALVVVSGELEVGVDVEWVRPERDVVALADRALAAGDAAAVREAAPEEQAAVFHRRWARHEARLKCQGVGLSGARPEAQGPLAVVDLDLGPAYAAAIATAAPELPELKGWTFGAARPNAG
jgi:4'-phosphopantetheinyl transferase